MNKLFPLLAFSILLLIPVSQNALASDPIVFESGGNPSLVDNVVTDQGAAAGDFILDEESIITDFHFVFRNDGGWDGTMTYFIFADNGGKPGGVLKTGDAKMLDMQFISGDDYMTWFDLEESVKLDAGTTYWFGLHTSADFIDDGKIGWDLSTEIFGNGLCFTVFDNLNDWICDSGGDVWFQLSGHSTKAVAGEIIPIESTSLLLAGSQSFSWMIPVLLSGIGIGLFVFRKSENS